MWTWGRHFKHRCTQTVHKRGFFTRVSGSWPAPESVHVHVCVFKEGRRLEGWMSDPCLCSALHQLINWKKPNDCTSCCCRQRRLGLKCVCLRGGGAASSFLKEVARSTGLLTIGLLPLFDLTISEDVFKTALMPWPAVTLSAACSPRPLTFPFSGLSSLSVNCQHSHFSPLCLLLLGSTDNTQEYKQIKRVKAMKESRMDPDAGHRMKLQTKHYLATDKYNILLLILYDGWLCVINHSELRISSPLSLKSEIRYFIKVGEQRGEHPSVTVNRWNKL